MIAEPVPELGDLRLAGVVTHALAPAAGGLPAGRAESSIFFHIVLLHPASKGQGIYGSQDRPQRPGSRAAKRSGEEGFPV